ncbi:MAG: glycoside hydrolase family 36 protein, partial [Anaerolineales bacterium]
MRVASLSSPHLHFSLNSTTGRWSLYPHQHETPYFEEARFGAIYEIPPRKSRRTVYWDGELHDSQAGPPVRVDSPHGQLTLLKVRARTPASPHSPASGEGLGWELEFALPADRPFFLWRVTARNLGRQPIALDVIDLLRIGPHFQRRSGRAGWLFRLGTLFSADGARGVRVALSKTQGSAGALRLHPSPARLAFFSNGYQSWSFAGALQADRHQSSSLFGPLGDPKALNLITPRLRQPGRFTSEMFGVIGDREHNAGVVAGFLSQREQFGAVEVLLDSLAPSMRLTAQCDGVTLAPGQEHATDWAYLQFIALDDPDPLGDYAEAVARENNARVPAHTPVGWCSWYHYFDKVTEDDITNNLAAIVNERDRLPLDFVQLDDGFQAQVGDWFETKPTFPRGLKWLAAEIRAHKQTPGLWLAPYMVRSDARLLRQHPNWFLRDARGRLVSAGFNWFKWCYALDPTHPEVREHVRRLITTAVREWGFPYLKLDFLYAAALPAKRYDPALTRAQAMRLALMDIREAAGPDTFI